MRLGNQRARCGHAQWGAIGAVCVVLTGCSGSDRLGRVDPQYGVSSSARLVAPGQPVPKGGGVYRVGVPYTVAGRTYVPTEDPHYVAEGVASWYGEDFHGRLTANGEIFDMQSLSAAHPTLPMPSYVRVTNVSNSRSVIVRVNDRGPYRSDRLIDVSVRTAVMLGFFGSGLAPVRVEYVGPAPLEGSDDTMLAATLREGEPAPAPAAVRVSSTKPFVPATAAGTVLRNVPVPPDRPYSLGESELHSNYRPVGRTTSFARTAEPEFPLREGAIPTSPRAPPIAAYAPIRSEAARGDFPLPALPNGTSLGGVY
jgi:peptidoglycan lytic transglycosylase